VLEAVFVLLDSSSPSRKIFIGSHSPPPLSGSPYRSITNGVLTVYGDLLISFKCDSEALEIATTNAYFAASAVMVAEAKKVDPSDLTVPEQKEAHRDHPGRHAINEEGLPRPCRPSQDGGHRRRPRGEIGTRTHQFPPGQC
jgi:hypothetical protein